MVAGFLAGAILAGGVGTFAVQEIQEAIEASQPRAAAPVLDAEQIAQEKIAPVVLLTAFSQRELVERARDAGAMAYVVKPFSEKDLVPAIELAVARFDELRALEDEVSDLAEQFATRKIVERAKSLLTSQMDMSEPEAFRWIQKSSMDRRLTMREVAQTVIDQMG